MSMLFSSMVSSSAGLEASNPDTHSSKSLHRHYLKPHGRGHLYKGCDRLQQDMVLLRPRQMSPSTILL